MEQFIHPYPTNTQKNDLIYTPESNLHEHQFTFMVQFILALSGCDCAYCEISSVCDVWEVVISGNDIP